MVKTKFVFGSLNVRGLKDIVKRKAVFLFCKGQKVHCLFLQETHSTDSDTSFWTNQWGDKIFFSHGSNRSGGVAICFNKCPGEVISYKVDGNGHWLMVVLKIDDIFFILFNIYGFNNAAQNQKLIEDVSEVITETKVKYPTDNIIVGGDWNMVPDEWKDRWPPRLNKQRLNVSIEFLKSENNLYDIWRDLYPDAECFSWFKPNGENKSRIDYWLVSNNIIKFVSQSSIFKAPLTDHCFIDLVLEPVGKQFRNKGYWKFNAHLLQNEEFCSKIKELIRNIEINDSFDCNVSKWEFLKFKIREFSIQFSKKIYKEKKIFENNLIREISLCCINPVLNNEEKNRLMELQNKLDHLYLERAQGAFVRSRARWIEDGEKNSSYFSNLEKNRQQRNSIDSLMIRNEECKDLTRIEKEVFLFYSNLYSSDFSSDDSDLFFAKIRNNIPHIDNSFKKLCDSDLRVEELDSVVMKLPLNKSPGTDGLTNNFFKFFWKDLRILLFNALAEAIEKKELIESMKQGLITLIPKAGKDKRVLDNLRPISLLNTDYKIFSGAIAARLKKGISTIISETQSGFLEGRSIHNNVRLVLDLLDYSEVVQGSGFLIFLDFFKAFDAIEHPFILKTLKHFGFGRRFINLIEMLYNDINSSVALRHRTCTRFPIKKGIRQGCSSSRLLFIIVAELLSILIKNNGIEGLSVLDRQIIISQFADDTTLFLKNEQQIPLALHLVNMFSKASGLYLNLKKCEMLTLHEFPLQSLFNIQIKEEVKYLGIVISREKVTMENKNVWNNIEKCKLILNRWLQRDLTIFGRVLLSKMDSLSRLIYPAFSMPISTKMIKAINKMNFKFIWRNKCQYIRKDDMIKKYEDGGVNAIDFDVMNGVLKLKWLKSFICNHQSFWYIVPSAIFKKLGGINFLLRCDFECTSLPLKLSDFHQQVLLYWKLLFKHNFTPHNTPVWNNRYIKFGRKSVFFEEWKSKGIWAVAHFLDDNGNLLLHREFCEKFRLQCTINIYNRIIRAIPVALRVIVKEDIVNSKVSPELRQLSLEGHDFCNKKCSNRVTRKLISQVLYPNPIRREYVLKDFDRNEVKKIRKNYLSYPLPPKVKEVCFKIINEIYPTKEFLRLKFNFDTNDCVFCEKSIETLEHVFFWCDSVHFFWSEMQNWLCSKDVEFSPFNVKVVRFGIFHENKELEFFLNSLICFGRFFIHKCRWFKSKPNFIHWCNELKLLYKSLKFVKNKKALKLTSMLELYNLI